MYPIANNSDLSEKLILENQVHMETIYGNPFGDFTGESFKNIVHSKSEIGKGEGQNVIFPLGDALDADKGVARGDSVLRGQEQSMRRTSDKVEIDYVRFGVKVPNRELGEKRSPIAIYTEARSQLSDMGAELLRNDLMAAVAEGLIETDVDTKEGSIITGAASPVQHRALFGTEDNYDADLATACGALDTTNDKMSVAMVRRLVNKAKSMAGTYSISERPRRITPSMIEGSVDTMTLRQKYVLFLDMRSVRDLQADPEFQSLRDDARNNAISMSFINRDLYIGTVDNVVIYEMPEIARIGAVGAGAASANVSHNLFCGAQALGLAWGNMGEFRTDDEDYGKDDYVAWHSIRGQKLLKYTPVTGAQYNVGLIHAFAATSL